MVSCEKKPLWNRNGWKTNRGRGKRVDCDKEDDGRVEYPFWLVFGGVTSRLVDVKEVFLSNWRRSTEADVNGH